MLKLAVVTLTKGDHHQWFDAMRDSVTTALPKGAEHVIIKCCSSDTIEPTRWDSLQLAEYVCFVDDDDRVINNSIKLCLNCLEANHDVAVAFTNERYIDQDGQEIENVHPANREVMYEHLFGSPQTAHHLCMIRTSAVYARDRVLNENLGIGGEWLMKAGTALRGGAIHVPIEGYEWRRHDHQHSRNSAWLDPYADRMHMLRSYLAAQIKTSGPIPRLTIQQEHQ